MELKAAEVMDQAGNHTGNRSRKGIEANGSDARNDPETVQFKRTFERHAYMGAVPVEGSWMRLGL